jgi:glycosyltransferase involved in cell wall biosynthesis
MTRPLIAMDAYNLALDQGTGVATYARNLSYRLGALGAEVGVLYGQRMSKALDPVLREATFFDPRTPREPSALNQFFRDAGMVGQQLAGIRALDVPVSDRVIRTQLESRLPRFDRLWTVPELFRGATLTFGITKRFGRVSLPQAPALMHWTYPIPLRVQGTRNIYTIHDMVPLRLPYATLDHKRRHYRMLRRIARDADHIVTVSETSKRDIVSLLGVAEEKVTNTYQAADIPAKFATKPEALARAEIAGSFGLGWREYFLFVGAIEPKKNVGRLIEAYLASGARAPLVICGRQAWDSDRELALLYEDEGQERGPGGRSQALTRKLRDRVILLDYAPFRLLVSLIRGARALLFPSLYEGFGLPVLEAMQLGTPVMTANTSSLPEVAGDAALLVDPYDTRAMAEAIAALDTDDALRAALSARGPRQAALFDNGAYERRLRDLYTRLGIGLP